TQTNRHRPLYAGDPRQTCTYEKMSVGGPDKPGHDGWGQGFQMTTDLAIDVRGLTKRFGPKRAVNGIDIAVPYGEVWGFLGPNGSGKTTTIRMLCGLLRADAGEGTCLGLDLKAEPDAIKRAVGYMTQRFSFWEDLSIRENLEFVARMYELDDARA